ncbi:MAG: hypothetical protein HYS83_00910 [Candidatus Blackburnbacteria bacterium]|nr:hypothetical protein [Candidatus Blackburnbacteria bacterium]
MLKITFEKPKISIGVSEETKSFLEKAGRAKKKEKPKPWTHKERIMVALFLAATVLLTLYFYYKGQGRIPEFNFNLGGFGFNQTVILEK